MGSCSKGFGTGSVMGLESGFGSYRRGRRLKGGNQG